MEAYRLNPKLFKTLLVFGLGIVAKIVLSRYDIDIPVYVQETIAVILIGYAARFSRNFFYTDEEKDLFDIYEREREKIKEENG